MASHLQPLRTLQPVETADRAALVMGREPYFEALREALLAARHTVLILGFHVDAQLVVGREGAATLREVLLEALARAPALRVYIAAWDYTSLPGLSHAEDEAPFGDTEPRLSFRRDARTAQHARDLASHHENVVVIDDSLAFVGGCELTTRSWHEAARSSGHATQLCLHGAVARQLGVLLRERLLPPRSAPPIAEAPAPWPKALEVDLLNLPAGIARTRGEAGHNRQRGGLREALEMTLAAIRSARQHIYIETPYFSAAAITEALCERLRAPDGPELLLVMPREQHGWLAQEIMTDLRDDALARLRAADHAGRLHAYQRGGTQTEDFSSRLMIVDGTLLKVGSSNLSNRSLSLDTECDVWLEAKDIVDQASIERVLLRLVALQLQLPLTDVQHAFAQRHSLAGTVAALNTNTGGLVPITPRGTAANRVPAQELEQPSPIDAFLRYFGPAQRTQRSWARLAPLLATIFGSALVICLLVLASDPDSAIRAALSNLLERVRDPRLGLAYVLLAFGLGTVVCAPITAMFAATALALDPLRGFFYALAGGLFSASISYALGRTFGAGPLQRMRGKRLARLRHEVHTRSFRSVLIARFMPVGNFTLFNVFLGSLKTPYLPYLAANAVGMTPSLLGLTLLSEQLQEALQHPTLHSVGKLVLIAGVCIVLLVGGARFAVWRRAQRERAQGEPQPDLP